MVTQHVKTLELRSVSFINNYICVFSGDSKYIQRQKGKMKFSITGAVFRNVTFFVFFFGGGGGGTICFNFV